MEMELEVWRTICACKQLFLAEKLEADHAPL
jgi:hypothetical protein